MSSPASCASDSSPRRSANPSLSRSAISSSPTSPSSSSSPSRSLSKPSSLSLLASPVSSSSSSNSLSSSERPSDTRVMSLSSPACVLGWGSQPQRDASADRQNFEGGRVPAVSANARADTPRRGRNDCIATTSDLILPRGDHFRSGIASRRRSPYWLNRFLRATRPRFTALSASTSEVTPSSGLSCPLWERDAYASELAPSPTAHPT